MFAKIFSGGLYGMGAQVIDIEVSVATGLRNFIIVGLPDKAVAEAKERVTSAIKTIGLASPVAQAKRIIVNLSPADLKKEGSHFDLSIALAYLLADQQTKFNAPHTLFLGELALNAELKAVKGVFLMALLAQEKGFKEIVVPAQNAPEAAAVNLFFSHNQIKVIPCQTLQQCLAYLEGRLRIDPFVITKEDISQALTPEFHWHWIKGQEYAKRAVMIAVAGGHNFLMQGPPGTGKTLLAKAAVSIMPDLHEEEMLELSKIYSCAGLLSEKHPVLAQRPFRAPHHTISEAAFIGGGNPIRPGEITLAHRGILFLDEFPEFHRDVLESLRQPLEQGEIIVQRTKQTIVFPARFSLIAAANPCPCGNYRNPDKECSCTSSQIAAYQRKLRGPLMDRFDLFCWVANVKYEQLISENEENNVENIKDIIKKTRQLQKERFQNQNIATNSEMNVEQIKKYCPLDSSSQNLLKQYVDSGKLSARGFHRILKVSRTIADLAGNEQITYHNVAEALSYRLAE